jgi:PST family polysaccharide transporter
VAGSVGYAVVLWRLCPDRPDLAVWRTTRRDLGGVLSFGLPAAGSNLLSRLIFNVDYLIVGRMLGATALGYYTLAFRIPELIIINVFYVISGVAFPMFSRLNEDLPRLRRAFLLSVRLYCIYGLSAGVGLALVAGLVVPLVFGSQWTGATAPLVPLALYAACRSIGVGTNDVYKAIGRPGLALSLSLFRLVVLVPSLVIGARQGGIVGVAWAQVGTALAMAVLMQARGARILSLRLPQLGRAVAPGLLAAAAVCAACAPLLRLPLPPEVELTAVVAAGVCAVLLVLAATQRPLLRDLLRVLRRRAGSAA